MVLGCGKCVWGGVLWQTDGLALIASVDILSLFETCIYLLFLFFYMPTAGLNSWNLLYDDLPRGSTRTNDQIHRL
jgi:hypothetical protein